MPKTTIQALNRLGAITLALVLSTAAVWAQQRTPAAPSAPQAAHFSNQQLRSFAAAALQVQRIARKARASLQAAKSPKAQETVMKSVESQQIQAVKTSGLTVAQYEAISTAARQNAKMRLKIGNYVKEDLGRHK